MPNSRYERVIQILDDSIGGPSVNIAIHGAFWRGLTRDQFVKFEVFDKIPLLVVGDGANSNLIHALKGEPPFGPGQPFPRMPAGGRPPVSDANIAFIKKWIDDGCPGTSETSETPEIPKIPETGVVGAFRWRPTSAPKVSARYDDIYFLGPEVGWAVNANGEAWHTADGARTWSKQLDMPGIYLRCITFASPTRGFVGTTSATKTLFETSDGGATWSQVKLPENAPGAICGLSAVSESVIYASGTNFPDREPGMLKTVDGGKTWKAWSMLPFADIVIDCHFTSPDRGWVVGGKADRRDLTTRNHVKPVVLLTEDGGMTWTDTTATMTANIKDQMLEGEWGWKIQFASKNVGFVSLESDSFGGILTTKDGGKSWTRMPINDMQKNANLEGIGFIDELRGWVGGWGSPDFKRRTTSETFDGGKTWHDANEVLKTVNRFRFFGSPVTVGYASGETIYKYSEEEDLPGGPDLESLAAPQTAAIFHSADAHVAEDSVHVPIKVAEGSSRLLVSIWDHFADHVIDLVDEQNPAVGDRVISWNRSDKNGKPRNPGYYILRARVGDQTESKIIACK